MAAGASGAMLALWRLAGPLPWRLALCPEFKVLQPVVGAVTVSMVDVFVLEERAAKVAGHDQTMFEHRVPGSAVEVVFRWFQNRRDIALLADGAQRLRDWVSTSSALSSVGHFNARINQGVLYLVREGAKAYRDLAGRLTGRIPCDHPWVLQGGSRSAARISEGDTERDNFSTNRVVLKPVLGRECVEGCSGRILGSDLGRKRLGDYRGFGHAAL